MPADNSIRFVVIVSADAEWRAVTELFPSATVEHTPFGEFFYYDSGQWRGVVMRGGWGKIDAAASAQYVLADGARSQSLILVRAAASQGRLRNSRPYWPTIRWFTTSTSKWAT